MECPGDVVDFENHTSFAKDHLPRARGRAGATENYVMSMARLVILPKHVHHPKDILHKYIVSRGEIARESPALSMPSVVRVWVP